MMSWTYIENLPMEPMEPLHGFWCAWAIQAMPVHRNELM